MGALADWQIEVEKIVEPFTSAQSRPGIVTYGVSSYGYDVRTKDEFQVFDPIKAAGKVIDPKAFDATMLTHCKADGKDGRANFCTIPANSFALAVTLERFSIPRSCIAIVLGKSTYARCGIVVNCTPLEPEWRGHVTLEISNTTPIPARIYANEGIAQVLFLRADGITLGLIDLLRSLLSGDSAVSPRDGMNDPRVSEITQELLCQRSYADKKGRYQDQGAKVMLPCVIAHDGNGPSPNGHGCAVPVTVSGDDSGSATRGNDLGLGERSES